MEENTTATEPEVTIERICALEGCGIKFTPTHTSQTYCCDNHRYKAYRKRKKSSSLGNMDTDQNTTQQATHQSPPRTEPTNVQNFYTPKERKDLPVPEGLNAQTKFIIDSLKEQRDDWKSEWKEERDARRKVAIEKEDLEKQLRDLKHEQELSELRNSKPGQLEGLMNGPAMQYIGPVLQEMGMGLAKVVTQKMNSLAAPVPGAAGLSGLSADIMSAIAAWMPTVSEETQKAFYDMMLPVMQAPEVDASLFFSHVINFIQQQQRGNGNRTGTGY